MSAGTKDEDVDRLRDILRWCDDVEDRDVITHRKVPEVAFRDMLARGFDLTERQRSWVRGVYERVFDEPVAQNLWSSGQVPRGEALATPVPEVLKKPLPMRPPGRKT